MIYMYVYDIYIYMIYSSTKNIPFLYPFNHVPMGKPYDFPMVIEDLTARGYFVVSALRHGFDFVARWPQFFWLFSEDIALNSEFSH